MINSTTLKKKIDTLLTKKGNKHITELITLKTIKELQKSNKKFFLNFLKFAIINNIVFILLKKKKKKKIST